MDLTTDQLLGLSCDAAELPTESLPPALRDRVLAAAVGGAKPLRHQGWTASGRGAMTELDAYLRTASELAGLLDTLSPAEWAQPTAVGGASVRDLVAHLVGVERYVQGQFGRRPAFDAPRQEDHWPVTSAAAADLAGDTDAVVAATWWQEALRVAAALGAADPDQFVTYHQLTGPIRGLSLIRTFELWTHGDDIRAALGRPLDLLDDSRLSLMAGQLAAVLPIGLALLGYAQEGRTARMHLTGAGGGSFDVPLAPWTPAGPPDLVITADTLAFCRLASNRVKPDELEMLVEGDRSLLQPLLAGAAAFSLD